MVPNLATNGGVQPCTTSKVVACFGTAKLLACLRTPAEQRRKPSAVNNVNVRSDSVRNMRSLNCCEEKR